MTIDRMVMAVIMPVIVTMIMLVGVLVGVGVPVLRMVHQLLAFLLKVGSTESFPRE